MKQSNKVHVLRITALTRREYLDEWNEDDEQQLDTRTTALDRKRELDHILESMKQDQVFRKSFTDIQRNQPLKESYMILTHNPQTQNTILFNGLVWAHLMLVAVTEKEECGINTKPEMQSDWKLYY